MRLLYFLSIFLHVLSAMIWIGGMIFLATVVVPVARRKEMKGMKARLIQWTGERFRLIGWICLILLVITGFVNFFYRGFTLSDLLNAAFWSGFFGRILAHKLALVGVIFVLSALHDFYLGPRATKLLVINEQTEKADKFRRRSSWIGRVNLIMGLIVVFLGIMLVRGAPF